ncbi:hypothetical protein OG21DRAFT_1440316 [Imleria badia]|nr:hypothetical protein OG21DRAFT_1440316 [Imleria badia]
MNNDSTTTQTVHDGVQHSKPIPISTQHLRHRSMSFSSDSTNSPTSSPPLVTPNNFQNTRFPASSSSPIFHFLSQASPTKPAATFPFRGFVPPPVVEDEPAEEYMQSAHHARQASTAGRFQPQPTALEPHHERGVNVLRRLSLGGHLGKAHTVGDIPQSGIPRSPPKSAGLNPPTMNAVQPNRKPRRSATVTENARPRRAPSPMGERILKGHFDGFN